MFVIDCCQDFELTIVLAKGGAAPCLLGPIKSCELKVGIRMALVVSLVSWPGVGIQSKGNGIVFVCIEMKIKI